MKDQGVKQLFDHFFKQKTLTQEYYTDPLDKQPLTTPMMCLSGVMRQENTFTPGISANFVFDSKPVQEQKTISPIASAESRFIVEKIDTSDEEVNNLIWERVMNDLLKFPFPRWEEINPYPTWKSHIQYFRHPMLHYTLAYNDRGKDYNARYGSMLDRDDLAKNPGSAWVEGFSSKPKELSKKLFLHLKEIVDKMSRNSDANAKEYDQQYARRVRRFFQNKDPFFASDEDAAKAKLKEDTRNKYLDQMLAFLEKYPAWEWIEEETFDKENSEFRSVKTFVHGVAQHKLVEVSTREFNNHAYFFDIKGAGVLGVETPVENKIIVQKWQDQLQYNAMQKRQKIVQEFLNTSFE